jgi:hypothetical protein
VAAYTPTFTSDYYCLNCGATRTECIIIFQSYGAKDKKLHLEKLETVAELKARLSREAAQYWGWLERTRPRTPSPIPPPPRTRNRCCSGSSRYMVN